MYVRCLNDEVQLHADATSEVFLAPRHPTKFQSLDEVAAQSASAYCMPISKTQESIDFVCQPDEMGQITTNLHHGAKAAGLRAAYAVLAGPKASKQAWLTFAVPPDKFLSFKRQETGPLDTKKFNIRQRVLKMPLVSQATQATSSIPMPALRLV